MTPSGGRSAGANAAEPDLQAETVVERTPAQVWEAVGDPTRMTRWSPECVAVRPLGAVRAGGRALNLNRQGLVVWPTWSLFTRFEPGRAIAWRVPASGTVWSLEVSEGEVPGTTRLVHRRTVPGARPRVAKLFAPLLGGVASHDAVLAADMHRTLAAIKADLER